MTDTDSLCYEIRKPASFVYRKLEKCSWMDFSNYNKSNHYQSFYSMSKYFFKDITRVKELILLRARE